MIERWAGLMLDGFNLFVIVYLLALNGMYLAMTLLAFWSLKRTRRRMQFVDVPEMIIAGGTPPVTLIAPAHNEEATCVQSVRSLPSSQLKTVTLFAVEISRFAKYAVFAKSKEKAEIRLL